VLRTLKTIRTFNDDGIKETFKPGHVVVMSPGYYQRQRDARAVNQDMPSNRRFALCGGVG
jgi:hypothetical protein